MKFNFSSFSFIWCIVQTFVLKPIKIYQKLFTNNWLTPSTTFISKPTKSYLKLYTIIWLNSINVQYLSKLNDREPRLGVKNIRQDSRCLVSDGLETYNRIIWLNQRYTQQGAKWQSECCVIFRITDTVSVQLPTELHCDVNQKTSLSFNPPPPWKPQISSKWHIYLSSWFLIRVQNKIIERNCACNAMRRRNLIDTIWAHNSLCER
jgi:hypothetical protein